MPVDADVDGDGFRDSDDLCPEYPGDESGCPTRRTAVVVCSKIEIAKQVEFAASSDVVPSEALAVLEAIAAALVEHTCIKKLSIVGHASVAEQAPAELSLRRAEKVADILAAGGVDRARLDVQGSGRDAPRVELNGRTTGFCHGHEARTQ